MSKLRLTLIGTCRIHNSVRGAAAKYPVEYQTERNYGFTHTSREALQQLDFLEGKIDFPPELVPGIFRAGQRPEQFIEPWTGADLVLVEISSLKLLSANDFTLQIRYLQQHFADFFGSPARSRPFWQLAEKHPDELGAFLESEPLFQAMTESDQKLLRSVRVTQQTFEQLQRDMELLVERIGLGRILFVTHVNALGADGRIIPTRDCLIRWVARAAEDMEAPCFNPTELMTEFGQERAMEREGTDTTHYTDAFYSIVYSGLHREFIGPAAQRVLGEDAAGGRAAQIQILVDSISATLQHVDLVSGSRELFAALRANPDSAPLVELRGILRERLGDFEGAVADLSAPLLDDHLLGNSAREALLRSLVEVGKPVEALELADAMLASEYESAGLHQMAARAAELQGDKRQARSHWKQLWRLDRDQVRAALIVLDSIAEDGPEAEQEWLDELAYFAHRLPQLADALAKLALRNKDEMLFARAAEALAEHDPAAAGDLLLEAADPDLLMAARTAISKVIASDRVSSRVMRPLREQGRQWGEQSVKAAEEGRFDEAERLGVISLEALGEQSDGWRGLKSSGAIMLKRARELAAEKQHQAVIDLCERKPALLAARSRLTFELMRALSSIGRKEDAVSLAREAAERFPDDHAVTVTAARLLRDSDLGAAASIYRNVEQNDPDGRYMEEIEQFRTTASGLASAQIGQAIGEGDFDKAVGLLALLDKNGQEERARVRDAIREALVERDSVREESDALRTLLLTEFPDDPSSLQAAAEGAMRQKDFANALDFWQRLAEAEPASQQARNNIVRCRLLLGESAAPNLQAFASG